VHIVTTVIDHSDPHHSARSDNTTPA